MKLISCYIESFGRIKNQSFSFKDGLNKLVGENGSGKTTLSVFIKVMLYGMSDTKKTNLDENDRKHYLPWEGTIAAGSMEFSVGNKKYRVERSFAPKASEDSFALYDLTTGRLSSDFSENIGRDVFGIDADGFERTVFLSERNLPAAGKNQSISAKLGGLVGCDGDIEGLDDAIKALEEQRRRYSKKGGGGEIYDVKAKITETDLRLGELAAIEARLGSEEERLKENKIKTAKTEEELSGLESIKERLIIQRAEQTGRQRMAELGERLMQNEKALLPLDEMFSPGIPGFEEINEISYKATEAKRLLADREENPEFERMSKRYAAVSEEDVTLAKDAISSIERTRERKKDPDVMRFSKTFEKRIPSVEELHGLIAEFGKKSFSKTSGVILSSGVALLLLGVLLGTLITPIFYIIAALGAVITALLPFIGVQSKKRRGEALLCRLSDFFDSIGTDIPKKEELKERLLKTRELLSRKNELYISEETEYYPAIYALIDKLPDTRFNDALSEASFAVKEYGEYSSLSVFLKYKNNESVSQKQRGAELKREVDAFLEKYRMSGERPFDSLRAALHEYERLRRERDSLRSELAILEKKVSSEAGTPLPFGEDEVKDKKAALEEMLGTLRREAAISERTIHSLNLALDERDELISGREELMEKLRACEEKYRIILLTKDMLSDAKDSMTAKYLGKTKAGFESYTKLISEDDGGSYEMNTSFAVSRLEGGRAKPSEGYSKGTRDLYNIASRLALIDSLYEGEMPPIILDDPFIALDDRKAKSAIRLLEKLAKSRQIIYFTCSESRS